MELLHVSRQCNAEDSRSWIDPRQRSYIACSELLICFTKNVQRFANFQFTLTDRCLNILRQHRCAKLNFNLNEKWRGGFLSRTFVAWARPFVALYHYVPSNKDQLEKSVRPFSRPNLSHGPSCTHRSIICNKILYRRSVKGYISSLHKIRSCYFHVPKLRPHKVNKGWLHRGFCI